jgi:hypothetical protein
VAPIAAAPAVQREAVPDVGFDGVDKCFLIATVEIDHVDQFAPIAYGGR